jgi:hypothetical protein
VLIVNKMISDVLVISCMEETILRAWKRMEPYIQRERDYRHNRNFHIYFEHLAFLVTQNPPANIDARLRLERMPISDSEEATTGAS